MLASSSKKTAPETKNPEWEKRKLYVEGGRSGFKGKQ